MSVREAARQLAYDHAYLSRVINGKQDPSPELVEALDRLLGLKSMLIDLRGSVTDDDRDRITRTLDRPGRLDAGTVKALSDVLAAQRRLDDGLGAGAMLLPTQVQTDMVLRLLRDSSGPHRDALLPVAAEWVQFSGWLRAEAGDHRQALILLDDALDLADDAASGTLAAQAANFKGYVARQQGNTRSLVRWFAAAAHTPGAHPAQRIGDLAQAAQGLALLGERDQALRLLDQASKIGEQATGETPPETAYWLTASFQRLNLGLAHLGLGQPGEAAAHLSAGLSGLPAEQRSAEWTTEYREALERAREES